MHACRSTLEDPTRIVAWDGSANVDECVARAFCPVERYGTSERADWRITGLQFAPDCTRWTVLHRGQPWAELSFPLAGEYNVLNATAAAAMAAAYEIAPATIAQALATFKSVKRRLEVRAEVNGITIIDDFAHHPTAIAESLKALRTRYRGRRLWAIFEPRSNTLRRKVFEQELARSLALADQVVITSIYRPEAVPEAERLSTVRVLDAVRAAGPSAQEFATADEIVEHVAPEMRPGDVVAILSNGGFGGIYEKLPQQLQALAGSGA